MSTTMETGDAQKSSGQGNAWTQTAALFVDAYRDLQSRKLFWMSLVLSLMVAAVFAFVGITETGVTIFGKRLSGLPFNSILIPPADFYRYVFSIWGIEFWLGFLASILALVGVGGIFPDFITGGSIDLYLSRPIGRLRLFLTKYLFGLLFTALQVFIFSTASFFVIGYRGGVWEFGIFLAVPLVTLFFSYLYCVCVLIGILTRSTLTALIVTLLFWGILLVIHFADRQLTPFAAAADLRVANQQRVIAGNERIIQRNAALPENQRGNMSAFEFQLQHQKEVLTEYQGTADDLHWWHDFVVDLKTPLPKTNETVSLMERWLVRPGALSGVNQERQQRDEAWRERRGGPATQQGGLESFMRTAEVQDEVAEEFGARKVSWIIGTSLLFEACVLGLAAWLFCRRDY